MNKTIFITIVIALLVMVAIFAHQRQKGSYQQLEKLKKNQTLDLVFDAYPLIGINHGTETFFLLYTDRIRKLPFASIASIQLSEAPKTGNARSEKNGADHAVLLTIQGETLRIDNLKQPVQMVKKQLNSSVLRDKITLLENR